MEQTLKGAGFFKDFGYVKCHLVPRWMGYVRLVMKPWHDNNGAAIYVGRAASWSLRSKNVQIGDNE